LQLLFESADGLKCETDDPTLYGENRNMFGAMNHAKDNVLGGGGRLMDFAALREMVASSSNIAFFLGGRRLDGKRYSGLSVVLGALSHEE
jgi:hypothetical protein